MNGKSRVIHINHLLRARNRLQGCQDCLLTHVVTFPTKQMQLDEIPPPPPPTTTLDPQLQESKHTIRLADNVNRGNVKKR